jgi:hypothetical protein
MPSWPRNDPRRTGPRPFTLVSDDIYEVDDDVTAAAAGERAEAAFVGYFDGPLSPARVAAARRGGRDRIRPALQQVPGLIRTLVLRHPTESKLAVVHLVTSADGLRGVAAAINSTPLLPDEDPSLLTGPDRVETHRLWKSQARTYQGEGWLDDSPRDFGLTSAQVTSHRNPKWTVELLWISLSMCLTCQNYCSRVELREGD